MRRRRHPRPSRRRPPGLPCASTLCSIAARSRPASPPPTACIWPTSRAWASSPKSSPTTSSRKLPGDMAIGHTRYSTTGDSALLNAQPIRVESTKGLIAIAHNGNLVNLGNLRARLERDGAYFQTTSDSEIIVQLIAHSQAVNARRRHRRLARPGRRRILHRHDDPRPHLRRARSPRLPPALHRPHPQSRRARHHRLRLRDLRLRSAPRRVRCATCCPANSSWSPATASPAASTPPAFRNRAASSSTSTSRAPTAASSAAGCRSPATRWAASSRANPHVPADVVVPVPDSGVTAALGYAAEAGIPFRLGLIRNHYVGRTFIEPEQRVRDFGVRLKLNPVRNLLEGKRVILIDDSIIRGTTSRKIVRMVRGAGAREVHLRISCPPTISPCFYGVDTPSKSDLIAANNSVEEIRQLHRSRLACLSFPRWPPPCRSGREKSRATAPPATPATTPRSGSTSKTSCRPRRTCNGMAAALFQSS